MKKIFINILSEPIKFLQNKMKIATTPPPISINLGRLLYVRLVSECGIRSCLNQCCHEGKILFYILILCQYSQFDSKSMKIVVGFIIIKTEKVSKTCVSFVRFESLDPGVMSSGRTGALKMYCNFFTKGAYMRREGIVSNSHCDI